MLDGIEDTLWSRFLAWLFALGGWQVHNCHFNAGHLRTTAGQAVPVAAARMGQDVAFAEARALVEQSPYLRALNDRWGRQTVQLRLARSMWQEVEKLAARAMTAESLARASGDAMPEVFLRRSPVLGVSNAILPEVEVELRCYGNPRASLRYGRLGGLAWIAREVYTAALSAWVSGMRTSSHSAWRIGESAPTLLLLREDDVSLDRSYRTQPHWLIWPASSTGFRTLILEWAESDVQSSRGDTALLAKAGVEVLDSSTLSLPFFRRSVPVARRALAVALCCGVRGMLSPSSANGRAFTVIARVFGEGARLADFCARSGVNAFMTCDNYKWEADAMQLVAADLGVRTISYQYSLLRYPALAVMTGADRFLTFAPMFHDRCRRGHVGPRSFTDVGYPFAGAFPLVRKRALSRRRQMECAGARFVIAFFDEGVAPTRYGLVQPADHSMELSLLLSAVLNDPSLGLLVKAKLQRNSPRNRSEMRDLTEAARSTGRFVELSIGAHRNVVLPSEAALGADIAIGHAFGGTAVLEAALAGVRAVLLDTYGIGTSNEPPFVGTDIVYGSIESAMAAIDRLRAGDPASARLGDWSGIIHEFDAFRDGEAAARTRKVLEDEVLRTRRGGTASEPQGRVPLRGAEAGCDAGASRFGRKPSA